VVGLPDSRRLSCDGVRGRSNPPLEAFVHRKSKRARHTHPCPRCGSLTPVSFDVLQPLLNPDMLPAAANGWVSPWITTQINSCDSE